MCGAVINYCYLDMIRAVINIITFKVSYIGVGNPSMYESFVF
jgi:hypothetical protein